MHARSAGNTDRPAASTRMPDLNTVPPSPHALAAAARRSSASQPPASPMASPSSAGPNALHILPSNQSSVHHQAAPASAMPPSPFYAAAQDNSGVGPGPGPLRHPRPLTASDLHMQLEKEQEAVVNRLTRELSILRAAHNASVVSNTSSTSAATSTHDPIAETSLLSGSGFSIPTSRRHHRTSSSASQSHTQSHSHSHSHSLSQSQPTHQLASSYEGRAPIHRPPHQVSLSRQNSAASRRSLTGSPAPPSSFDPSTYFQAQRFPNSIVLSSVAGGSAGAVPGDQMSPGLLPATVRYEETAYYRSELESAKKENEALKRRIRELERLVRGRRASDASRPRSDSVSTTASANVAAGGGVSIAGPRDGGQPPSRHEREPSHRESGGGGGRVGGQALGVPDDEVTVGESAASGRLTQR